MVLWRCIHWSPFPACREPFDQVRVITILSYRNQALCYSRTVAYFSGPAMLFSSGDSPQSASSNLSGEGFDEVQPGESPFFVSAACHSPPRLVLRRTIELHGLMLGHACAHAVQRQRVRPSAVSPPESEGDHHDERCARTQCRLTAPEDFARGCMPSISGGPPIMWRG
jgi:hypothetical protein